MARAPCRVPGRPAPGGRWPARPRAARRRAACRSPGASGRRAGRSGGSSRPSTASRASALVEDSADHQAPPRGPVPRRPDLRLGVHGVGAHDVAGGGPSDSKVVTVSRWCAPRWWSSATHLIWSAAFSATIMVGALVLPRGTAGMTDARRPAGPTPRTLSSGVDDGVLARRPSRRSGTGVEGLRLVRTCSTRRSLVGLSGSCHGRSRKRLTAPCVHISLVRLAPASSASRSVWSSR